jgi:hypothetical protein
MYYCELGDIKSEIGIAVVTDDDIIYAMMDEAKEAIDNYCNRRFDKESATTKYYDGAGSTLWIDDIYTITSISIDEDGDGTYESTLSATDYIAYPLNKNQKSWLEISNDGDYGGFANGIKKGVKIVGTFGWEYVPSPVVRAAKIMVISMYNNRQTMGKKSETLGDYSYTMDSVAMPDIVKELLNPYRKFN